MSFLDEVNRIKEINQYISLLEEFGIDINNISRYVPKCDNLKGLALKIAMYVIEDAELQNKLMSSKELPIADLCILANVKSRTVKRLEKYIKSICLIHIYQLEHLKSMVEIEVERRNFVN